MADPVRSAEGERAARAARFTRVAAVVVAVLALAHLALAVVAPPASHDLGGDVLRVGASAGWIGRILVATGASVCFLLGPGVLWRRLRPRGLITNTAFLWIPGALYLMLAGAVAWAVAAWVDPTVTSAVLLVPVPIAVLWCARGWTPELVPSGERVAIVLFLLVLTVGIGVSTWSMGPEGELYSGTVSRTLEAGPRSDPRISFNMVMLVAHADSPYAPYGVMYYEPYTFYDRGPIAGMASGAVVMAGGASPPRAYPDEPWEPFDPQGFMTYRIMMMLLNASAVLSLYGLAASFLRRRIAVAAAALVALSPFVLNQTYFTWPKLLAGSFVIVAAVALLRRRSLLAGLLLGLAYLAHPSALFAVPALMLGWLVLREWGPGSLPVEPASDVACGPKGFWRWCLDAAIVGVGLGVVYFGWQLLNAGHVTNSFDQYLGSGFGKVDAPLGEWLRSRADLTVNTIVPFRQTIVDARDTFTNAPGLETPFIVRVGEQWRGTVTVAVGLLYLPMFLYGIARFARRTLLLTTALFVVPLFGFLVFWGANTTGAVQEGLHAFFLLALLAACIGHTALPHSRTVARWVQVSATARVVEVLFMAAVPTVATTGLFGTRIFHLTDAFALVLLGGGALGLAAVSWYAFAPSRVATPDPSEPVLAPSTA